MTAWISRVWKPPWNRKLRAGVGLMLVVALCVQCQTAPRRVGMGSETIAIEVLPIAAVVSGVSDANEQFARNDPLGFLRHCREQYDRNIRDYRCTFIKQERVGRNVKAEQVTDVRFRESPFSVDMVWTRNADMAAHALYVAGRWVDGAGNALAWVRPSGLLGVLKLKQPIHGAMAKKAGRRTIDQFGFKNTLGLIIRYAEMTDEDGALDLRCVGTGKVEGRCTYVFERRLPYTGEETPYPDRLLVFHIDQEWLVPTACFSYADDEGNDLLGRYITTDVQLNPGYADKDFDPVAIGF